MTWESQGVLRTFFGVVSSQDLLSAVRETGGHTSFDQLRIIINDFSATTKLTLEPSQMDDIAAARIGALHTNARIRVVMVGGLEVAQLAAAWDQASLEGTPKTAIFSSVKLARDWLSVQPPLFGSTRGSS